MLLIHITSGRNISSILEHGLLGEEDEIFDEDSPHYANGVNFTRSTDEFYRPISKGEVLVIVDTAKLDPKRLTQFDWMFRYAGDVPRDAIVRIESL